MAFDNSGTNSGQEKWQFTPFSRCPKPGFSDSVRAGIIEGHNFLILCPILVKFHIQTGLIESFLRTYRFWWCGEGKLHFTPVHTLRELAHRNPQVTDNNNADTAVHIDRREYVR